MSGENICLAIASRRLISFYYDGESVPGYRTVEPHMVAYNSTENLALSAWYLSGASESSRATGWREYLVAAMRNITVLEETFQGPRPGYQPNGGKSFHRVVCAL